MRGYLYLVRHGITSWNISGRLQGEADIPLSEEGTEQANVIGKTFQRIALKQIFCSSLSRAVETSKQIEKCHPGLNALRDERLSEIKFGEFSGKTLKEVAAEKPEFLETREINPWNVRWPSGENYQDVQDRLKSFLKDNGLKLTEIQSENIVIVSHETTNRVLIGMLMNLDKESVMGIAHPNHVIYRLSPNMIERLDTRDSSNGWQVGTLAKTSAPKNS